MDNALSHGMVSCGIVSGVVDEVEWLDMRGCFWVGVLATWLSSGTSVAVADRVLDKPAFAAEPSELLALGKAAPPGDWPVVVLRDQHDVSYDDKGRATVRWRTVFVVRTRVGIEGWGTVPAEWRPFYQHKPVVRARVIDPSGEVAEIDPALVGDAPATQVGTFVFSDRRRLEAPLPRLQIGAVVEQEIVTIDREPMLAAGTVDTTPIGGDVPTLSTVIAYSAPAARNVHHVARRMPAGVHPRHQIASGRESWVYQLGALPPRPPLEPDVPGDVVVQPYVGVGTAASWMAVARGYRAVLDERIAGGPVELPAELPRIASIDTVQAIAAWIRRRVRYTGIELGQASIVPWPPAETVRRGFGDCKDLAVLQVALLRKAGIRADVVLLDAGPGQDIDPDLPGMGGFDHAIVRARLDGRDVWIDPTEEMMRAGQLPPRDAGRRALVIAADTRGLSVTPTARSGDNTIREVRTFIVAESGRSQAIEVTSATGAFESTFRWWFRISRADEVHKSFAEYVERSYNGALDRVTPSDAEDLTTPFEATVAVKDSRIVYTDPWHIDVHLRPGIALGRVPATLTDSAAAPRTQDYAWPIPHTYEVENRIVVPHGFQLPTASDRVRSLGPVTLTERRRVDGQTVIVAFRFETGRLRLTARELAALQDALFSIREEEVHFTIEQTALELGHAGKLREAVAECERLIALHPGEAAHHAQLAMVLLGAGAGEAARRAARKAVELGPTEPEPLSVLGWTLSHDTLGRLFTHDWDREGAIASYRKARMLDPGHRGILNGLADALARDRVGRALETGSDPRAAIEVMRAAYAVQRSDDHALKLASLLVWTGELAEGEQIARTATQSEPRDRLIVLAVAAASGARAAIRVAGELRSGPGRTQLIEQAAWHVLYKQRYDVAREMFAESGTAQSAEFTAMLDKLASHTQVKPGTGDPRSAVIEVLEALVDRARKTAVFWDARLERGARGWLARLVPAQMPGGGQLRYREDVVRSAAIQIDGSAGVWRATVDVMGQRAQVYLALDRGSVKLVGTSTLMSAVGRYVLATLGEPGGEARGRRLLDWLRAEVDQASEVDEPTFKRVWGSGLPSSREAIALAAAVLAGGTDADRSMAVALRCPSAPPAAPFACHEVLAEGAVVRERWSDALPHVEAMVRLQPDSAARLERRHTWLLGRMGRLDEADKRIDAQFARDPVSREALGARLAAAQAAGQMTQAVERADALAKHPDATSTDLNSVAWLRLGANDDLQAALELARKAVQAAPKASAFVNTLAAIEAELGDLDRAVHDNWKVMEMDGTVEPLDSDWYVAGRIYEQLGLTADATAAYNRIAKSTGAGVTSYSLAQNRLAALRPAH
jgi:tetratricopeptide (TPR) repeat protein/transglutaminase-like putative cysteine protease